MCKQSAFSCREKKRSWLQKIERQKAVRTHAKCIMAWSCQVAIVIFKLFKRSDSSFQDIQAGWATAGRMGYGSSKAWTCNFPAWVRTLHGHTTLACATIPAGWCHHSTQVHIWARWICKMLRACVWCPEHTGCVLQLCNATDPVPHTQWVIHQVAGPPSHLPVITHTIPTPCLLERSCKCSPGIQTYTFSLGHPQDQFCTRLRRAVVAATCNPTWCDPCCRHLECKASPAVHILIALQN